MVWLGQSGWERDLFNGPKLGRRGQVTIKKLWECRENAGMRSMSMTKDSGCATISSATWFIDKATNSGDVSFIDCSTTIGSRRFRDIMSEGITNAVKQGPSQIFSTLDKQEGRECLVKWFEKPFLVEHVV